MFKFNRLYYVMCSCMLPRQLEMLLVTINVEFAQAWSNNKLRDL